ncbi:MAG: hypothetical protein IPO25_22690 [Saprospiraceae bacterium]|nr:hypothetical protein [Saprospiraceae bacterium]
MPKNIGYFTRYISHPDLQKIRPLLFWDTQMEKINWQEQKAAVLQRVYARGNEEEIKEIEKYYNLNSRP